MNKNKDVQSKPKITYTKTILNDTEDDIEEADSKKDNNIQINVQRAS